MFDAWVKSSGSEPLYPFAIGIPYVQIKKLFRYINEAFGLKCFTDLLQSGIYPNAKEITESMAAYDVARHKMPVFELSDPDVTMIAIADGCTPRTAAMFAFRSAWQCISIDPNLHVKDYGVKRLKCIAKKVEDCEPMHFSKLVIAAVHSHAPLDVVVEKFTADKRLVIAIPCCYEQSLDVKPDLMYADLGIWSPKNIVKVWNFVNR